MVGRHGRWVRLLIMLSILKAYRASCLFSRYKVTYSYMYGWQRNVRKRINYVGTYNKHVEYPGRDQLYFIKRKHY